jgi:hypothetical protein
MRYLRLSAVLTFLAILPALAPAATPTWEPATAVSVIAYAEHSDFRIESYLSMPNACYSARIRTALGSAGRTFFIEQMKSATQTACSPSPYHCSVVSNAIALPIPQTIAVSSANKKWKVHVLTEHEPAPAQPMCKS